MKRIHPIKKVPTELDVLLFPAAVERPVRARCLNCDLPLSLSQPDLDSPERLLGVCEQCKHWFFIHLIPDQTKGLLFRLARFRRGSAAPRSTIRRRDDYRQRHQSRDRCAGRDRRHSWISLFLQCYNCASGPLPARYHTFPLQIPVGPATDNVAVC